MRTKSPLRAGEWVEVLSKREILDTLDAKGEVNGLPFMPEMWQFCGKRFRVAKRAHKTCDPPNGLAGRRMDSAVHLERVRCDGTAHGGCQAACLIFWKEAWLKKVDAPLTRFVKSSSSCTEDIVQARTQQQPNDLASNADPVYVCQSTQVAVATRPLRWWDFTQYVEDYTSGNVRISQLISAAVFFIWHTLATSGLGVGTPLRAIYDGFQKLRGGVPYPWRLGKIPGGAKTPSATLNLQPGELVQVKSYPEILATLDENGVNRGMWFDAEMVPYCGGTYRVQQRVGRIINEKTGRIQHLKNECIMLEDVVCRACYAKYRKFCPRAIPPYWREIWLERVTGPISGRS